jgi:uncharacterized protein (TIGR03067 family)
MRRCIPLALLAALTLPPAPALVAPAPQVGARMEDARKLQGTWRGYYIDQDGKADTSDVAEVSLVFEKDTFKLTYTVLIGPGEATHITYEGTFTLHPTRNPKAIDMRLTAAEGRKVDGKDILGIYEVERDTLKWCISEMGEKQRPGRFATREKIEFMLFEFKKDRGK